MMENWSLDIRLLSSKQEFVDVVTIEYDAHGYGLVYEPVTLRIYMILFLS